MAPQRRPRLAGPAASTKDVRRPGLLRALGLAGGILAGVGVGEHHLFIGCRLGVPRRGRKLLGTSGGSSASAQDDDARSLWKDALDAERGRSELLLAELQELQETEDVSAGTGLEEEVQIARKLYEECAVKWGEDEFQQLRGCNDRLQQAVRSLREPPPLRSAGGPSGSGRLDGIGVVVESLPPVTTSDEFALVAGAAHVRVSLPLGFDGLMWGSDLTPLFDEEGDRLMVFIASLPLGMRIATAPRPPKAPAARGELIVVEAVSPSSEAESNGIRAGDVLRALSYLSPEDPSLFDKFLGAPTMLMPRVLKCDGLSAEEVSEALQTNSMDPGGTLTLLLERPP